MDNIMAKTEHIFSCPIGGTLEVFAGRWKPEILWQLKKGPMRFNQLLKEIGSVSQKMLTQQLRDLQRDGLVDRKQYEQIPPRVEYKMTELAKTLQPIFNLLADWGVDNSETVRKARADYDESL